MPDITWHTEQRRLGDLIDWDKNPRQLSKHDAEHIHRSIDTFGLADPLIINLDDRLIGGHQRKLILLSNGATVETRVDVRVPSRLLTDRECEELAIRLNKNSGDWDFDLLANGFEVPDLLDWGFTEEELQIGGFTFGEPSEDPGAQIDKAEELREKWGVESGQLWQLGDHRLICGDCTDKTVVERAMDGEKAGAIVTDPPYGMDLNTDYSTMPESRIASRTYERIEGDNQDFDASPFIAMFDYCKEQFWWGGDYYYPALPPHGSWIVWDKRNENSDGLIGNHFELCWSRTPHRRRMIRHHWSGVNARNQNMERLHPTEKSIDVIAEIIDSYIEFGAIIVDLFSGSGTTLIACERLGRKCRAVEISPAYCAVAIQRWVDMTGGEPVLLEDGQ